LRDAEARGAVVTAGHDVTPFLMVGYVLEIHPRSVVPGNALSTGATMRVNGIDATIPKDTVALLPSRSPHAV